jgi:hypothetical protein
MTDFNRYEFTILDVCQQIKGEVCGSHGGLQLDQIQHRYQWLKRRLSTWDDGIAPFSYYDRVVKELAATAVTIAERRWPEWKQ